MVTVHEAVDSLRKMMVDIYPPDLTRANLTGIVDGLAAPLRSAGLTVEVVDRGLPDLDPDTVTALYRVAREALQNVGAHARAGQVCVELATVDAGPSRAARLTIADDGAGLPAGDLDRRTDGHLGLQLLRDRVAAVGGTLVVASPPTGGTSVVATLPASPGGQALRDGR